jgi:hypothetical protein
MVGMSIWSGIGRSAREHEWWDEPRDQAHEVEPARKRTGCPLLDVDSLSV